MLKSLLHLPHSQVLITFAEGPSGIFLPDLRDSKGLNQESGFQPETKGPCCVYLGSAGNTAQGHLLRSLARPTHTFPLESVASVFASFTLLSAGSTINKTKQPDSLFYNP